MSANNAQLPGSLTTAVLTNYGSGSLINDNALRFLTLAGTGGTLTLNNVYSGNIPGNVPYTILYLTLTGLTPNGDGSNTLTDLNSEINTLNVITTGLAPSILTGIVDKNLASLNLQGSSSLTLYNPPSGMTSYTASGTGATLVIPSHSDAALSTMTLIGPVTYTGRDDAVSSGITLNAANDPSNIIFTTTGALTNVSGNTFSLGNGNNVISDVVTSQSSNATSTVITAGSGSNQFSTGSNTVNIRVGQHAAGITDRFNVAGLQTTITGAQPGDTVTLNDATQFVATPVTAAQVTAAGGNPAQLSDWISAALSPQGANLPSHAIGWFNFGNYTLLVEQANAQGAPLTAGGNTVVTWVGVMNESAAVLNGHTLTLS